MHAHAIIVHSGQPLTDPIPAEVSVADAEMVELTNERFGIDNAKELQRLAYNTPQQASVQLLVVRTAFITVEAQNALLKLLEEPPATSRFVLLVPASLQLLPTLLSRVQVVGSDTDQTDTDIDVFKQFQALAIADRLKMIETELKKKDSTWMYNFQQSYLRWLQLGQTVTSSMQLVAERLNTRGASNKMLLELLALELGAD